MSNGPTIIENNDKPEPRVIVLAAGERREINTNYTAMDVRYQADGTYKNGADFFNSFLEQATSYEICAFLNEGSNFAEKDVLHTIVDILSRYPLHGGLYTDTRVLDSDGNLVFYQIHPSYDPRLVHGKFAVNGPLFIKTSILDPFDDNLSILYMWDKYVRYCRNTLMYHIAKPVMNVLQNTDDPKLVSKEFKMINEKIQAQ